MSSRIASGLGPPRSESIEPIVTFEIRGHSYAVYPVEGSSKCPPFPWDALEKKIVGELTHRRNRFVIVSSGDATAPSQADASRRAVDVLTKRELQIVTLVAAGRVNKEIAVKLGISEWTVSTHMRRIFAKLGVDSRAAMVYRCSRLFEQLPAAKGLEASHRETSTHGR
jgi:DNA-binding CsgD family transcriptional regulator